MATQADIPSYEKGSQGADVGHARCVLHDWGMLGAGACTPVSGVLVVPTKAFGRCESLRYSARHRVQQWVILFRRRGQGETHRFVSVVLYVYATRGRGEQQRARDETVAGAMVRFACIGAPERFVLARNMRDSPPSPREDATKRDQASHRESAWDLQATA